MIGLDLGLMVEGVLEIDSSTGRAVLRVIQDNGPPQLLDIQEHIAKYVGREIRFICTPLDSIAELARMVAAGDVQV